MEIKLQLSNTEHKELVSFCNLNDLLVSSVVKKSFTTGFNIERYGLLNSDVKEEKQVVKEVIVEKRVEVPVEVIKEVVKIEYVEVEKPIEVIKQVTVEKPVEIIKEVPVERVVEKVVEVTKEVPVEKIVIQEVIKEVPIEKIVYVTDQEEMKAKLFQKEQEFDQQRKEFSSKTQELENIFQNDKNQLLLKIQQLENEPPKIVEVIKEIPVEKVVIQEKIVEIEKPIEIVKEVFIEKGDDSKSKLDALQQTVLKLKTDNIEKDNKIKEYEKTIQEIQKFQQDKKAMFLRGSNLDDNLYK